jgi:hypothetical protein
MRLEATDDLGDGRLGATDDLGRRTTWGDGRLGATDDLGRRTTWGDEKGVPAATPNWIMEKLAPKQPVRLKTRTA